MKYHLLFSLTLGLITSFSWGQTTVSLTPSKDNSIYEEGNNLSGGQGRLYSGPTCQGNARRALIQFDLSSIPSGVEVTSVNFSVDVSKVGTNVKASRYSLHRLTTEWGEGASISGGKGGSAVSPDATWQSAQLDSTNWNTAGGDFNAIASAKIDFGTSRGPGSVTDTTALIQDVQDWLGGDVPNFGWILIGEESESCTARQFGSKETGNAPQLTITYKQATNIQNQAFARQIRTYPNPTTDFTHIHWGHIYPHVRVSIRNVVGQTLATQFLSNASSLDLSLPTESGLYLVEINTPDQSATIKVWKQ